MSVVTVHGNVVHDHTVIDSVLQAVVKGIEFLKGTKTVQAMREERFEPAEDLFSGVVYDRINQIMEEARNG